MRTSLVLFFLLTLGATSSLAVNKSWVGNDFAGFECAGRGKGIGPFDYRDRKNYEQLSLVEAYHFSRSIERLENDNRLTSGSVAQNIDYTLMSFPNHHRALNSLVKFALREELKNSPLLAKPECYLMRAENFARDDFSVKLIFGIFLHRMKMYGAALEKYEQALKLLPDSSEAHYNLGLLYLDMGEIEKAKQHANQAYENGYPLQGLHNKLKALRK